MMLPGWRAYRAYLAVKLHFTDGARYDFFEMRGGITATEESYAKRKDRWMFAKLDKEYPEYHDLLLFLAINFFEEPKTYIKRLISPGSAKRYNDFVTYQQSLTYNFGKELVNVLRECSDDIDIFSNLFANGPGTHPAIFQMLVRKEVTPWFFILIDGVTGFVDDLNIQDPVLWQPTINHLRKFKPFMTIDWDAIIKVLQREVSAR